MKTLQLRSALIVASFFLAPGVPVQADPTTSRALPDLLFPANDPPFEELVPYFDGVSRGGIRPVTLHPAIETDRQDLFYTDVALFNQNYKTLDFLETKRSFYGALPFDKETQRNTPPYRYDSSWRSLFHPPIKRLDLPIEQYNRLYATWDPDSAQSRYFDPVFQESIDEMSGTELTFGNQLTLLPNQASFAEKLRMVHEAKRYFFGIVMIYACDGSTRKLLDEMIRRKQDGVDVRIMVDGMLGRTLVSTCLKQMRRAGIPVVLISDNLKKKSFWSFMHNKFWIRDGEEAIIGGQNMHENSNMSTGFNRRTRDTDLLIRSGPAVTDLLREYVHLWQEHAPPNEKQEISHYLPEVDNRLNQELRSGVRGASQYERLLSKPETRMNGVCRVLVQSNSADRHAIAPVIAQLLIAARSSVFISSPGIELPADSAGELHWPNRLEKLLELRAHDGVKVDVLSNGLEGGSGEIAYSLQRVNEPFAKRRFSLITKKLSELNLAKNRAGARRNREHLLTLAAIPGVRAWTYFEFIHAKTWNFDRIVTSIGSMNFDNLSTEKNHESVAICMDKELGAQWERQTTLDLINSVPVVSSNGR